MNISKFTQKSIQAIQDCEKLAYDYGNQEIEQEHLLLALLTQEESLLAQLIQKMDKRKSRPMYSTLVIGILFLIISVVLVMYWYSL